VEMFSQAGKVGPAYCTGVGKAMLAYMPEPALDRALLRQSFHAFTPQTLSTPDALRAELAAIRMRGYAFDREEHESGIICVAVPILSRAGQVIGALSVTSTTQRTTLTALEAQSARVKETAAAIAAAAENWRFPEQNQQGEQG
jgi:IclR family transcriptional regulator, KDG regulon repressor